MFPWNIAKSAEAMFSRFALRRICKFLLKKKLGQFILGDIDLDQLDVQLTQGIIHLCDLAINVDYLNHELGGKTPVRVRAGSIHSLLLKMPWSGQGCHVEIDELELQLGFANNDDHGVSKGSGSCYSSQDEPSGINFEKHIHHAVNESTVTASISVHEGVKAVASMIKSLLTSFHVKIEKVIVAMDPSSEEREAKSLLQKTLVLRIAEIECGTQISTEDFLQVSRLTNFLKFEGATLELLQVDDIQGQEPVPSAPGWASSSLAMTTILTGEKCGFSGTLNISLPWDNGSLDIRKVDADVHIDPIKVKFEPSILKWFFIMWETLSSYENEKDGHESHECKNTTHSIDVNLTSSTSSSAFGSSLPPCTKKMQSWGSSSVNMGTPDFLLPGSNLIFDWVPFSGKNQKDGIEEADLDASVDQFFECFDGMRSSQSLLGGSGMWNWTCSVFSAITAASSLASGSPHFPIERQHIETNLKVNVSEVMVAFFFFDEDAMDMQESVDPFDVDSNLHYVGSRWVDIDIIMQVCPKEWKFEATVKNFDLDDYFVDECEAVAPGLNSQEGITARKTRLIKTLQDEVQNALPSNSVYIETSDVGIVNSSAAVIPLLSVEDCASRRGFNNENSEIVKASLLKTYGTSSFQIIRTSTFSDGSFTGPASFSLKLPPFVFWANLNLLNMLLNLLERIQGSCGIESFQHHTTSEVFEGKQQFVSNADAHRRYSSGQTTTSFERSLQGNIFLPNARVILCFPFKTEKGFTSYISWDQFIALDFSSHPKTERKSLSKEFVHMNKCTPPSSYSLHLNIADAVIYLITMASNGGQNSGNLGELKFSSHKVLSMNNKVGCSSVVSMLWPKNAVTGSWITKSAKLLATSGEFATKHKSVRKGYEFASVATRKDIENWNSQTRKEMVSSSEILLHVDLSSVMIILSGRHYAQLDSLLKQLLDGLSCSASGSFARDKETSGGQRSILIECDALEILVNFDPFDCTKSSLQRNLPGSWTNMKLDVNNFQCLSVSNTGGVKDANLFWLAHAEGRLCGSVNNIPGREFVLIVCNNNEKGRGDGEGLNVLSSRTAGSDIIHFYNSESIHNFISVTVKCGTIFAPGGRLDWLDSLCSFFKLPSQKIDQLSASNSLKEAKVQDDVTAGCSFILNLVDAGFSYEPHSTWSVCSPSGVDSMEQPIIACLLAASSLKVSNTTMPGTSESEYHIQIQDIGLLLRPISEADSLSGDYSFGDLHKIGYTKVASETLLEAVLRMNWQNGLVWELSCFESHIVLSTCHDTTIGLMHLASQIQQLLAPDVEESLVHFQNRWQAVQKLQGISSSKKVSMVDAHNSLLLSEDKPIDAETESVDGTAGLLDMIYEDAFHLHANCLQQLDIEGTEYNLADRMQQGESFDDKCPENLSECAGGSFLVTGSEGHGTSALQNAELIEGYCFSELCPLSDEILKSEMLNVVNRDVRRVNSGWYGNTSLQILDNHIPDETDQISSGQVMDEGAYANHSGGDNCESWKGRVHLNNVNVKWQMFSGSDWYDWGQNSGGPYGRDKNVCLELELLNMKVQYDIFPEEDILVSKLCISIEDFCLYDKSKRAPWKLVLGYYASNKHPRESSSKALKVNLEAVRPDPSTPLEEYRLHAAVLPILLHLHQTQLDFLIEFFGGKSASADSVSQSMVSLKSNDSDGCSVTDEALLPFFQKFDIQPIVLRVDYRPSRVDLAALSGGKYVELVNVVPWKGVELQLKHVQAVGVYGWKNLCEIMSEEWLEDISHNQIHKLLHGLPPIRSLVAVGSGAAKLISLPISSYRKDQKLLKGLQRGTIAFLRSISVEAIRLGVHLAGGAHDILLHTESILACMQPSVHRPSESDMKTNVRSDQPRNAQQGLQQACESLSDGLGRTTSAIIHTPMKSYHRGSGASSALVSAVRGAPAAAIAPASAAAQALHCALLGFRNALDPEHKKESINKYSGRNRPSEQS